MTMGWATEDRSLRQVPVETLAHRYAAAGSFSTRYWTPEVHKAAFALPRFIADLVG
jgi:spermidine synthase